MKIKILKTLAFLSLACFIGLAATGAVSSAKTVKGIKFKNFTNITKYDVTGDGKKDTVRIDCEKREESGWGTGWSIKINGEVVYKERGWSAKLNGKNVYHKKGYADFLTVIFYPVSKNRLYFDIEENSMDDGDIFNHGVYQSNGGKLKCICDFYNPIKKNFEDFHYYVGITSMSSNKMIVTGQNQFYATSMLAWDMAYKFLDGKWKLKSKAYKVVKSINTMNHGKDQWTLKKNMVFYKKASSKSKAFSLKRGDKIQIKKICFKNNNTYMEATLKNGRKGWFLCPKKSNMSNERAFFEEAFFAG